MAEREPTEQEWAEARKLLAASDRPITTFRLGGQRPADTRLASWWGGNFVAPVPEDAPGMLPLFQICVADLPPAQRGAFRAEYLLFWIAPEPDKGALIEGRDFIIRELAAPETIPPTDGQSSDEGRAFALFQMHPESGTTQRPAWEDFAHRVPDAVAWSHENDWFFDHPNDPGDEDRPLLIGGWPQWIQGAQTPEGSDFVLQISSTGKGMFMYGDGGNLYLWRRPGGWELLGDFY
ncbi:hypothetical protein [Paracoccus sp. S1E-3]|uniref:hypothetical protein n=1 Tax=Paracoccus sp. S1E-3 TaxID=2756130 RepID=UPI0015EEDB3C|nr:hypothetical protein [Paracoccus sp. S1E-3]MBA4492517.1 hypothetical protein [Paracoccus sp. S1E-3]